MLDKKYSLSSVFALIGDLTQTVPTQRRKGKKRFSEANIYLAKFLIQVRCPCQCRGIALSMVHAQIIVDELGGLNKFNHLKQTWRISYP